MQARLPELGLAAEDTGAPMPSGSRGSEVVTVVTPLEDFLWFEQFRATRSMARTRSRKGSCQFS